MVILLRSLYLRSALLVWVLLLGLISVQPILAQSLGNIDLSTVRVDNLTDSQIREIWRRGQSEGLSVQEIGALAQAEGMPAAEASKLQARLNDVRTQSDPQVTETQASATRQSVDTRQDQQDMIARSALSGTESDQLQVFGSNLFRGATRSFEPAFNIPTPVDYTLGAGDELVINVWGAAEATYRLQVTPEGVIRIPNLGPIFVDGLTIEQARTRIINQLGNIFSGLRRQQDGVPNTFAEVNLGQVRSIQIVVLGEVSQPGTYTITSLSTVFNALYAAGGPNRRGSFREIQVIRGKETIARFDIYDFLVYGDQTDNIRLRDQDIIKIPPYKKHVRLRGEVRRPALYEIKEGETLAKLIEIAGGFTEKAYTERLVLRRKTATQRSIIDVRWPEGGDLALFDGDDLRVGEIIDRYENRVTIRGAIFRPGEYELTQDMTLTQLIKKAEGLREDAYPDRGLLFRTNEILDVEMIPFSVRDITQGLADDIVLNRDDIVQISSLFDLREEFTVGVSGRVNSPGSFTFVEGMTLEDAIYLADGFRHDATPYRIELARRYRDGDLFVKGDRLAEIFSFDIDPSLAFTGKADEFVLMPFDRIFVRSLPNFAGQQTVRIRGEVNFPGEYVLSTRNARISDLIEWAGGISEFAYLPGATLFRDVENDLSDELALIDDRIRIRQARENRVGINLEEIMRNPQSSGNMILRPGDILEIPLQLQTVRVEGEVLFPVSVRYEDGMRFRHFVNRAGGYGDMAQRRRSYVIYANGDIDRSRRFLLMTFHPEIKPGATIVVPREEEQEQLTTQERIAIYASLISMAAIVSNTLIYITRN